MQGMCDRIRRDLRDVERKRAEKGRRKFEKRVRRFERGFGGGTEGLRGE